jgi:hypothetical protein
MYLTGISRLQALFRVLVKEAYIHTDDGLDYNDRELWGPRLTIGFFIYLGLITGEKVEEDDQFSCGSDEIDATLQSPPHIERNINGSALLVVDEQEIEAQKLSVLFVL